MRPRSAHLLEETDVPEPRQLTTQTPKPARKRYENVGRDEKTGWDKLCCRILNDAQLKVTPTQSATREVDRIVGEGQRGLASMSIEVQPVAGSDSFELRLEATCSKTQEIDLVVGQIRSAAPSENMFRTGDETLDGRIDVRGERGLVLAWLGDDRRRALLLLLNGLGGAREWTFRRNQLDCRWKFGGQRHWNALTGLVDAGFAMLEPMQRQGIQAQLLHSLLDSKHGAYKRAVLGELLDNYSDSPETKQAIDTAREQKGDLALALLLVRPDVIKKESQRRAILRFGAVKSQSNELALGAIAMMVEQYGDDRSTADTLLNGLTRRPWKVWFAGIRALLKTPFAKDAFATLARVAFGDPTSSSRLEAHSTEWLDGNEEAREAFTTLLKTPNVKEDCRYGCLKALVAHFPDHPETREILTETALTDKEPRLLELCANVLLSRHIDDPRTAAALEVAAHRHPDAETRRGFLRSLFWRFEQREETVRAFARAVLRESDEAVHRYATDVLVNSLPFTPEAVEGLCCVAKTGETPEIRVNAVIKLDEAGVPLAEQQLKDRAVHQNLRVRLFEHLVVDLPPALSKEPVCALLRWADSDVDEIGHEGFDAVVREINADQSSYVKTVVNKGGVDWVEVAMEYLDWVEEDTQLTIVEQVTEKMPGGTEGWLVKRLDSDYRSVQLAAVRALARCGTARAIGPLRECRKGLLVSSDLENEAKKAEAAIQERIGGAAGGLSLAEDDQLRGALTVPSKAGTMSLFEDDEKQRS